MINRLLVTDVRLRTKEDPSILINAKMLLAYYNVAHEQAQQTEVNVIVKAWAIETAMAEGWAEASFIGSQLLLNSAETPDTAVVTTKKPKKEKKADDTTVGARGSSGASSKDVLKNHVSASVAESEKLFKHK